MSHDRPDGAVPPSLVVTHSSSLSVTPDDDLRNAMLYSIESETLYLATATPLDAPRPMTQHPPVSSPRNDHTVAHSYPHPNMRTQPQKTRASRATVAGRGSVSPVNGSLEFRSCSDISLLLVSPDAPPLAANVRVIEISAHDLSLPDGVHDVATVPPLHTPQSDSLSREFRCPQSLSSSVASVTRQSAADGGAPHEAGSPVSSRTVVPFLSFAQRPVEPVSLSADHATLSSHHRLCKGCRRHEVIEITDLCLYIPQGSFFGILSTAPATARAALQLLAGTRMPTSGTVLGNEVPTFTRLYQRRVAWISDLSGLTGSLSVRDNLFFAYRMRVADTKDGEARVIDRVATALGLEKLLDRAAGGLGLAHSYLLCVALELVLNPAVLLLDNPLVYFTPPEVPSLFLVVVERLIGGVLGQPMTVIVSTTDITWPLYRALSGLTVLACEGGETIFSGSISQLEPFLHGNAGIPNAVGESIADLLAEMQDTHSTADMAVKYRQSAVYRSVVEQVRAHGRRAAAIGRATTDRYRTPAVDAAESRTNSVRHSGPEEPPLSRRSPPSDAVVIVVDATNGPSSPRAVVAAVAEAEAAAARTEWSAVDAPLFMRSVPSYGTQFGLLLLYMVRKNVTLSLWYLGPWLCLFIVFVAISAIVVRLEFSRTSLGPIVVQNYCGVVFMILASACQTGLVFVDVEIDERLALRHFVRNHYLRRGQYLLATVLRLVLVSLTMASVGLLCALLLGLPVWPLTVLMSSLFLVQSLLLLALVYLCGGRRRFVFSVQGAYYLYSTLFSGYLVNANALPLAIQSLSMLRYAYGGVLAASVAETCARTPTEGEVCAYARMVLVNNRFDTVSPAATALLLLGLALIFFTLAAILIEVTVARATRAN